MVGLGNCAGFKHLGAKRFYPYFLLVGRFRVFFYLYHNQ